jgi:membrane-bound ClpP family serine protease
MSIGTGIALFIIGAVLTFALNLQLDWIDLDLVGYLFMGAGVIVFIIGLVLMLRKRQSVTTVHQGVDPATGAAVSERRTSVTPDDVA